MYIYYVEFQEGSVEFLEIETEEEALKFFEDWTGRHDTLCRVHREGKKVINEYFNGTTWKEQ